MARRPNAAKGRDREERVDALLVEGNAAIRADPALARKTGADALRLARGLGDASRVALCELLLGSATNAIGEYDASLAHFSRALDQARRANDTTLMARAGHGRGVALTGLAEFRRAFEELAVARDLAESAGALTTLAYVHNSLAVLYNFIGDFPRAVEHLFAGRQLYEQLGDIRGQLFVANNLGVAYCGIEDLEAALEQFMRGIELASASDDRRHQSAAIVNVGNVLRRLGRYDEALVRFEEMLPVAEAIGDTRLAAFARLEIATVLVARERFADALAIIRPVIDENAGAPNNDLSSYEHTLAAALAGLDRTDEAIAVVERILERETATGNREGVYRAHEILSTMQESMGRVNEAFEHHKLYTQVRDEVVGRAKLAEITQMRIREEIAQAAREREVLRIENDRLAREMEAKNRELTTMALQMVEKNRFLDALRRGIGEVADAVDNEARRAVRGLARQVERKLGSEEEWQAFEQQFELVHPDFIRDISRRHPDLSRTELKVCALLKLGMSSKEIAEILASSAKTVDNHRYNIRRKLELSAETNLATHFASL